MPSSVMLPRIWCCWRGVSGNTDPAVLGTTDTPGVGMGVGVIVGDEIGPVVTPGMFVGIPGIVGACTTTRFTRNSFTCPKLPPLPWMVFKNALVSP